MCGTQDKNARDLLMHLHCWHEMAIRWYRDNMAGKTAPFLPEGYNWKTTPELNFECWNNYQGIDLIEAKRLVAKSHEELMGIIKGHSDEELFAKERFPWTGTTSLGSYLTSAHLATMTGL